MNRFKALPPLLGVAGCLLSLVSPFAFSEDSTPDELLSKVIFRSESGQDEAPFIIEPLPIDSNHLPDEAEDFELAPPPKSEEPTVLSSPPVRQTLPRKSSLFMKITSWVEAQYERSITQKMIRKIAVLKLECKTSIHEERIKILDKLQELLILLGYSQLKQALESENLPRLKDLLESATLESIPELKSKLQSIESRYLQ